MSVMQPAAAFFEAVSPDFPQTSWGRLGRALVRASEAERLAEEQRLRIAQLEAMLYTDDLTGLYNRRALLVELEREIKASAMVPESVGIAVVLDLDGIRGLNECFGPAVGDAALRRVGQVLWAAVRPQDIIARIGGDEFAVLLTQVGEEPGLRLVDTLIQRFQGMCLEHQGRQIHLRADFGWQPYGPGDDAVAVLAKADLAMARSRATALRAA